MKGALRAAASLLPAVLLLCACGADAASHTASFLAMDTLMELTVCGRDGEAALTACEDRVRELEGLLSVTDGGSDIYRANHSGGDPVTVSPDTADLLREALALCADTGGALDVTVYPIVKAWGFTGDAYQVPSDETIAALLENVDYRRVALSGGVLTLPAGMELDLGAVAKGYAGDSLLSLLRERGVSSAILELGGSVHALGSRPDGSPWRIAVQDPEGEGYAGALEVRDLSVVTSGGYQRYFVGEDGEIWWHIMDPATGRPARSGAISVTVVSDSGTVCDALSTALFVMGPERSAEYWRARRDFDYVLLGEDGTAQVTEGLADSFSLLGGWAGRTLEVIS